MIVLQHSLVRKSDTKIYNIATSSQDHAALQKDLDLAMSWSEKWDIYFQELMSS